MDYVGSAAISKKVSHLCLSFLVFIFALGLTACTTETQPLLSADLPPTTRPTLSATGVEFASAPTAVVHPTATHTAPTAPSAAATNPPLTIVPATVEVEINGNQDNSNMIETNRLKLQIGDHVLTATFAENSSVDALKAALSESPITINMRDYESMEKVGPLGMDLPRNDQQITTGAGDIILYQGSALVIYYAPNSWSFTRLGKINDVSAVELREILGDGNVTVTLSLAQK